MNGPVVHPDDRMVSSLEDVYAKLAEAEAVLADLGALAVRHLGDREQWGVEKALSYLLVVKARVMPDADVEGPF